MQRTEGRGVGVTPPDASAGAVVRVQSVSGCGVTPGAGLVTARRRVSRSPGRSLSTTRSVDEVREAVRATVPDWKALPVTHEVKVKKAVLAEVRPKPPRKMATRPTATQKTGSRVTEAR